MKRRTRTGGAILMLALLAAGLLPGCAAFREAFSETPEQTATRQRRAEQRKARESTTAREEVFPSFFQKKEEARKPSLLLESGNFSEEERAVMERELNRQNELTTPGSIQQSMPRTGTPPTDDWVFGGFELF